MRCRLHSCNGRIGVTVQTPYGMSWGDVRSSLLGHLCPVRRLALSAFLSDSEVLYYIDISGALQGAFVSSPITLCTP
jgi:hypothetical protein